MFGLLSFKSSFEQAKQYVSTASACSLKNGFWRAFFWGQIEEIDDVVFFLYLVP